MFLVQCQIRVVSVGDTMEIFCSLVDASTQEEVGDVARHTILLGNRVVWPLPAVTLEVNPPLHLLWDHHQPVPDSIIILYLTASSSCI